MKRILLLAILVIMAATDALAQCTDPYFKGGEEKLNEWFDKKMNYPPEALVQNKSGKVTFTVTISEKGKVSDFTVTESTDPIFTEEAVRLIENMPKWQPARCNGHKTSGTAAVTITFDIMTGIAKYRKKHSSNWFGTAGAGISLPF